MVEGRERYHGEDPAAVAGVTPNATKKATRRWPFVGCPE